MDSFLQCVDPDQLAVLSVLVAIAIADGLDVSEQNVLGNFIVAVGSAMLTIAAQRELLKEQQQPVIG